MANDITLSVILTANVGDLVAGFQQTEKVSEEATESIDKGFENATDAIEETEEQTKRTSTELNAMVSIAENFAETTSALVDFAKEAAGAFLEFNGALAEVTTLVNSAEVPTQQLSNSIMNLSLEYGAMPIDTAKAMYQTLSAGASAGESANNMLAVAMQTSIGGVTDVTTAVDGLTTVVNAYGMDASQASQVADTMFTTMKNGKTTIAELSSNYSSAIPTAAALGVSFEELNAAVVGMTLQGTGTAETMTSLNRVMASLTKPSDDLNAIFNALGFSSAEVAIKQEGLGFALNAISNAAGGSVSKIGELLGSVKASAVVLSLAGDKAHFLTDAMEKMKNKSGALSEGFEKVMTSPEKQFEVALNKIQVAVIKFGEQAIRAFAPFLEGLGAIIDRINVFANESPKMFSAITQGITLFAALAAGVGAVAVVITGITAFVGALGPVFITAATAITTASVAMKGFVLSLGPIGLALTAATLGFTAMSYFAEKSSTELEESHQKLKGMLTTAKTFNDAITSMKDSGNVSDEAIQHLEGVKAAVMSGRMAEAEGLKLANAYIEQVKKRAATEEALETQLAQKKDEAAKLAVQRDKEVATFRINNAMEVLETEKKAAESGYADQIKEITDESTKNVEVEKKRGATVAEIAKIQAESAQKIIALEQEKATKSTEFAEKTFQKKKELIEAEGGSDVQAKVYEAEKELAQKRIDIAQKTFDTISQNLAKTRQEYEEYANQIKSLDKAIADEKLSAEDKIAAVRRRGMTEQQAQAAIAQQLAQREAQLQGAFSSKDTEGVKAYTDSLIGVAKQSEDTDQSLASLSRAANEALKAGNTEEAKKLANAMSEIGEKVEDNAKAENALQTASNIRVAAMEKEKATAMEAQKVAEERIKKEAAAQEAQRVALEENTKALQTLMEGGESKLTISVQSEEAQKAITDLETQLSNLREQKIGIIVDTQGTDLTEDQKKLLAGGESQVTVTTQTDQAKQGIEEINTLLKEAQANAEINVKVNTTEAKAGGGVIGFATGDVVPGVGDSDSVHAMLTPGEYVIRKARSMRFRDLLNLINYGSEEMLTEVLPHFNLGGAVLSAINLPTVRLAAGGQVPSTVPQSTTPTDSIRIDFSSGTTSGSLLATPVAEARKFAAMLREMKRG